MLANWWNADDWQEQLKWVLYCVGIAAAVLAIFYILTRAAVRDGKGKDPRGTAHRRSTTTSEDDWNIQP